MQFCNLHSHSIFSLRDSIAKPAAIVARAKELNHAAVCLTDHGTIGGGMLLYKEAKKQGIKPILGCEMYVANRSRFQKEKGIDKYYHITLLAMNDVGWRNLSYLVSESNKKDNFYYKPRIDRELLKRYNEGLICLSGCIGGELSNAIMRDLKLSFTMDEGDGAAVDAVIECADCREALNGEKCEKHRHNETYVDVVRWFKSVFGDRYYLEVQNHNMPVERRVTEVILDIAEKEGIKVVATNDSHVVDKDDIVGHDIMLAIRNRITINDEKMNQIRYPGNGYHILSVDELAERFPGRTDVITNSLEIADRCNLNFHLGDFKLPHVVDIKEEDEVFRRLVYDGLKLRGKYTPEYIERAEMEMKTIIQMTFPSYFMIVSDYIRWAKKNKIPVGPGRGSAAGSLVAYALNITNIDPIEHGTSFARFLNSGRASVPMIDFKEFPLAEWRIKQVNAS